MVVENMYSVTWGDMDANGHMRNTAYLDKSADIRLIFFAACGYRIPDFERLAFGPIAMKDEIEYRREVHLHDQIRATMMLAGLAEDGNRVIWRNEFYRDDTLAARVSTLIGWLDRKERKLMAPPAELLNAMRDLPRSDDFSELPVLRH
jgi:acyl-CoA thioester hydrolase